MILGDLNEDDRAGGVVRELARRLNLVTRRPPAPTYDFAGVRRTLDWVLVSKDLRIETCEVSPIA